MAHITRIKAKDPKREEKQPEKAPPEPPREPEAAEEKSASPDEAKDKKSLKIAEKESKVAKKVTKSSKSAKKPKNPIIRFITWPFRYIRESWQELRQVRWPSRGAAWKMVFAVLVYTAIFVVLIMLLDALFTFIFNTLLAK